MDRARISVLKSVHPKEANRRDKRDKGKIRERCPTRSRASWGTRLLWSDCRLPAYPGYAHLSRSAAVAARRAALDLHCHSFAVAPSPTTTNEVPSMEDAPRAAYPCRSPPAWRGARASARPSFLSREIAPTAEVIRLTVASDWTGRGLTSPLRAAAASCPASPRKIVRVSSSAPTRGVRWPVAQKAAGQLRVFASRSAPPVTGIRVARALPAGFA
jgi:hypothetical protein